MILYSSIFNSTGAFPDIVGVDITVPDDGTGTEFIAAMVNDEWGARQDLINRASLTPDTVTEASGTSQSYEAMQLCFGHPGEVVGWHGAGDPSTVTGLRLLLLDGSGITAANFPDLVATNYVGDANNGDPTVHGYFKADDAAGTIRNIAGVWFILPDSRGAVLRGHDPTATVDPQGASRLLVPNIQFDAFEQHGHELRGLTGNEYASAILVTLTGSSAWGLSGPAEANRLQAKDVIGDIVGGKPSTAETRAYNLNVRHCVRY